MAPRLEVGNNDFLQGITVLKRAYVSDGRRNIDLLQSGAVVEHGEILHTLWYENGLQTRIVPETTYFLDSRRNGDVFQFGIICESCYFLYSLVKDNCLQAVTTHEVLKAQLLDAARDTYLFQCVAIVERAVQFSDTIRQRQRFKLLATDERLHHVSDG